MPLKSLPLQVEVSKYKGSKCKALHTMPKTASSGMSVGSGMEIVRSGLGGKYQEDVLAVLFPEKNLTTFKNEISKGKCLVRRMEISCQ